MKKISIRKNFNDLFMKRILIGILFIAFFYYGFLFNYGQVFASFMVWYSIIILLSIVYLQIYFDVKLHKHEMRMKNIEEIIKRNL